MHSMMEKLVKHLQIVRVRSSYVQILIFFILPYGLNPVFVLIVAGNVKQDFFFLHRTLCVLVRTLLDLQRVQLLVL